MQTKIKIALGVPDVNKPGRHFSFRLKQEFYNESSEYQQPSKILVLSDIEGNFIAFRNLLIQNKVIDRGYKWLFEDGHLVIVGDCFDRGEQVTECLWLIYSLEERARRKGGYVHFILGNHEIMNMNGDWRYLHPKYASSSNTPYTALFNGNSELTRWMCTKNIIEKIGKVLFVHGGIAEQLLRLNLSVAEINSIARPHYVRANRTFEDPALKIIYNSELSPFWYRGFYNQAVSDEQINAIVSYFNVNTIVTGHTVVNKISSFYNGSVINVDTDHASGISEALFIKNDRFYRMHDNGKRERLK